MTQFWSVNYICQVCNLKLLIWDNLYIDRFLLLAFVKCVSHRSLYLKLYFLVLSGDVETCFLKKIVSKSSYIPVCFFIQKPVTSLSQDWLVVENCPIP